ncbi:MAG: triose-phosphate isomerase [Bacteroidia bacterium]|nr:triose-phosphate isomerase [Bacteroidia bacterium]
MRKRIVAGNWKMNTDVESGLRIAGELMQLLNATPAPENVGVAIAPPYTHLSEVNKVIDPAKICLAAQNCASEGNGAYTGEVAVGMLKSVGVMAVIIGPSERRAYFKEDHASLAKKVDLTIKNQMRPIFCCGEVLDERNAGIQNNIVETQLMESLFHLNNEDFSRVIIAYEPVWAIGTGVVATPDQAQEMHKFIRSLVTARYGTGIAEELTILYGGSCKSSNALEIFSKPDVDGGLIGGASLDPAEFHRIVQSF